MATFTPEDQTLLDELNYRKNYVAWQEREAAREARLSGLAALTSIFTAAAVTPFATVSAAQSEVLASSDPEVSGMLSNIATVMGYTGQSIVSLIERLSTAEPAPMTPSEAAKAAAPDAEKAPVE
ncbi:hypothetical protein IFR23_02600 [Sphingomonas sp. CFBP 13603]|uniref:hypothetical protein n=1 Tax=Sphingomonas sp. CFBP 13603 TaxID=2774040 RepID=UPI0018668C82|nr:hypothetical protein [Sphingomonas sp. CFBP 13603]MBE2990898.1 hypothetical protein [Sphingomonas sp. CFBP 13603]